MPSRRRNDAPADSSPPKPSEPSSRPGTNHLKPTGTSTSGVPSVGGDPVDHRGGHQGLADRAVAGPVRRGAEEVADGDREVVVGVHQAGVGGDDAVPVGVGVVAGGDVVLVLAADQRGHRVRRGAVHPDLAVPVQRHEPPGRVDQRVDHGQVEAVPLGDLAPVGRRSRRRAGRRRCARPPRGSLEVEHRRAGRRRRCPRKSYAAGVPPGPGRTGPAGRSSRPPRDQLVGAVRDPAGGVGVGRAAVRRVVLEAAVGRAGCATGSPRCRRPGRCPAGPCRGWPG